MSCRKICIDPGHSGPSEPGAYAGGVSEAEVNLLITKRLGTVLADCGYEVIYTREGDIEDDALSWRAELANEQQADLFISIHCNAAENTLAQGFEIYHYPNSVLGKQVAENIHRAFNLAPYTSDRGIKKAEFTVLSETVMPAILVECAFLTSADDRKILTDPAGQAMISLIIAIGIHKYFLPKLISD